MSDLTLQELAELFSDFEDHDWEVTEVTMHPTSARSLREDFAQRPSASGLSKDKKSVWKASLVSSSAAHKDHVVFKLKKDALGHVSWATVTRCLVHGTGGTCPECVAKEVMEA